MPIGDPRDFAPPGIKDVEDLYFEPRLNVGLRDEFAKAVLPMLIHMHSGGCWSELDRKYLCDHAYMYADEMLRRRRKT